MAVKKTIYIVRHGESQDNIKPVFQSADPDLSPLGEAQIEQIAERLSSLDIDIIISSPLKRALKTAKAISKLNNAKIETSKLFIEIKKPKSVEGKPFSDKKANEIWREWKETVYGTGKRIEDSDNYTVLIKRVDEAMALLLARQEENIVVTTHGIFIRLMIARILFGDDLNGKSFRRFVTLLATDNTGVTTIELSDAYEEDFTWRLKTFNDHSHLKNTKNI
ncbi:MAG: histidine phosphatase family protein [bacterium]